MRSFLLSIVLLATILPINAQNAARANQPVSTTLNEQYSELKSHSSSYKENNRSYKVINTVTLDNFWNGVLETVRLQNNAVQNAGKAAGNELLQAKTTIADQAEEIKVLKQKNMLQAKAVQQNASEIDNISVLGLAINKQVFLILIAVIILSLLAFAGIMASLYKKSNVITNEKITAFQAMDQEFNDYKRTARDRELKVKRELQTELNLKEELKKQLANLQKPVS